jgi:hypothetical protein
LDRGQSRRLSSALQRGATDAAEAVADRLVEAWNRIDAALAPMVGEMGVAALYRRTLHLCAADHAWLAPALDTAPKRLDTAGLRAALRRQDGATAAAAGGDLLQTFHELLAGMVGATLTARLLRPVWAELEGGDAAEDHSP